MVGTDIMTGMVMGTGRIGTSPYSSPYPIEKVKDFPYSYPYPYSVNVRIPR